MGLLDDLPKNPKIDDLVAVIGELSAAVARNDTRITELETSATQAIAERTVRITELEHAIADHQAGAVKRQQELDRISADAQRLRWAIRAGRRP